MTIEEKAKRYDEAFGIARNVWRFSSNNAEIMRMEELFPELKESEDEKIRNQIINFIEEYGNPIHCEWQKDWIAWLEKQNKHAENNEDDVDTDFTIYHPLKNGKGHYECIPYSFYGILSSFSEDKDIIDFLRLCFYTEEECNEWIKQNESTDNVESKFHEGDWIISNDKKSTYQVIEVKRGIYVIRDNADNHEYHIGIEECEKSGRLFTIQDAKDGDALYSPCNKLLWIFKTKDTVHCGCNLNYNNGAFIGEGYIMMPTDAIPATKSQRDTLFAKMKEEGYEWSEETHELKKISQRMVSAEAKEALYDKPTDEEMKEFTIKVKYNIGDKVWIMLNNYPVCLKIIHINIQGGDEDTSGATSDFGKVRYYLSNDKYKAYVEEGLCDTFEELRDKVFSEAMRENVEED